MKLSRRAFLGAAAVAPMAVKVADAAPVAMKPRDLDGWFMAAQMHQDGPDLMDVIGRIDPDDVPLRVLACSQGRYRRQCAH